MEELGFGGPLRQVSYENTYITTPEEYGPQTKFERHKVYEVLVQMLKAHLEGQQYDPVKSSQISKMLADDLREAVRTHWRSLCIPRHELNAHASCHLAVEPTSRPREGHIEASCCEETASWHSLSAGTRISVSECCCRSKLSDMRDTSSSFRLL